MFKRTFNEAITEAHATATEKGWHDKPLSLFETCVLIRSEISEALECYRDEDPRYYQEQGVDIIDDVIAWIPDVKPEGYTVELIDTVIRILDFVGEVQAKDLNREHDFDKLVAESEAGAEIAKKWIKSTGDFLEVLNFTISDVTSKYVQSRGKTIDYRPFAGVVYLIKDHCIENGDPFWRILKEKMEYNKTRAQRHGGKVL